MYGSASSRVADVAHQVELRSRGVVRVDRHVLVTEVGEEQLRLRAFAGEADLVLDLAAAGPRPSAPRRRAGRTRRARTPATPSIAMSRSSGAIPAVATPTAWTIRPQFGSPPYSAVLTSEELATARADRCTVCSSPPRTTTRPTRRAPSPSRTTSSASWRSSASSASPNRSSSSVSGSTSTPDRAAALEDHRVAGRQLAVDADPLERALDGHAEQQVAGLRRQLRRRSARTPAASRSPARSCPRPWPGRSAARCRALEPRRRGRRAWRTRRSCGSPRRSRRRRRREAAPAAAAIPRLIGLHRQRHADHAGRGDRDGSSVSDPAAAIAAAACIAAASSRPGSAGGGVRVAGVDDHGADPVEPARSIVSSTGAASVPERVNRAALVVCGRVGDQQPQVGRAARLDPARDAGGPEALAAGLPAARSRAPGASIQRELKNASQRRSRDPLPLGPARTSG